MEFVVGGALEGPVGTGATVAGGRDSAGITGGGAKVPVGALRTGGATLAGGVVLVGGVEDAGVSLSSTGGALR
ncbi:MAG: hypothetical protein KF708_17015 [Pirellulales bacterium]|nr:hypothetical protein [Pirellulales bacterium]